MTTILSIASHNNLFFLCFVVCVQIVRFLSLKIAVFSTVRTHIQLILDNHCSCFGTHYVVCKPSAGQNRDTNKSLTKSTNKNGPRCDSYGTSEVWVKLNDLYLL